MLQLNDIKTNIKVLMTLKNSSLEFNVTMTTRNFQFLLVLAPEVAVTPVTLCLCVDSQQRVHLLWKRMKKRPEDESPWGNVFISDYERLATVIWRQNMKQSKLWLFLFKQLSYYDNIGQSMQRLMRMLITTNRLSWSVTVHLSDKAKVNNCFILWFVVIL